MRRSFSAALLVACFASLVQAQGPIQRAGQALDNAGKNIRRNVEGAVARGQLSAQERDLLNRVSQRLSFDKQLVNSVLQLTVRADGSVVLQGSIPDLAAKSRAVDLAQSTLGVTSVVDELAVVKSVTIIEAVPARVIVPGVIESRTIVTPVRVVEPVVPVETKVIVKP